MLEIILRRFYDLGILDKVILIGSWAGLLYREYFNKTSYRFTPRTTDIDFLVPTPLRLKEKVDLPKELEDLNYIIQFSGQRGYIKLGHPELSIEFIVPERGRGSDKPYPLNKLAINAQPLRYMDLLIKNVITLSYKGIPVHVPHPTAFVLQKLILISYRKKEEKKLKDIDIAKSILYEIANNKDSKTHLKSTYASLPKKWQSKIIKQLTELHNKELVDFLQS